MANDPLKVIEAARKAANERFASPVGHVSWKDNDDADVIDNSIDNKLKTESEDTYRQIAQKIVDTSSDQLKAQNDSKNELKLIFTNFFIIFISVQYLVLIALLFIKAFIVWVELTDALLISYITSVFVETIGAIVIMITYAFDSKQEVNILKILNGVISNYQKFHDNRNHK